MSISLHAISTFLMPESLKVKNNVEKNIYFPFIPRHGLNRVLSHFRLLPAGFICQGSFEAQLYCSKFWIKRYFPCYPELCLSLSSWQNKAGMSDTDLLPTRGRMRAMLQTSRERAWVDLYPFSPLLTLLFTWPFLSCLLIQGDSVCYCSLSDKMTALHVFGTLGDNSDTSHWELHGGVSASQSISRSNQDPPEALCGFFRVSFCCCLFFVFPSETVFCSTRAHLSWPLRSSVTSFLYCKNNIHFLYPWACPLSMGLRSWC